ncbi:MAG: hypothetical protein NC821_02185 [Candidatus Omnitrophica bacterium]|nr:hypothetical protein [Candidatus Omnitrophota bacterium]
MKRGKSNHPQPKNKQKNNQRRQKWEKPNLEDVSEKIMAQPYIRFT